MLNIRMLIILVSALAPFEIWAQISAKIIYGPDDRREPEAYPSEFFRKASKSVAGMIDKSLLTQSTDGTYKFNYVPLSVSQRVCPDETFADQNTLPVCSGVLVGKKKLLTAGHCIQTKADCQNFLWAFGLTKGVGRLDQENIYSCKRIISRALKESKFKVWDYAIIELDRNVVGRSPLRTRKWGYAKAGTPLVVIGHPSGLPLKISDNANILKVPRKLKKERPFSSWVKNFYAFNTNLDTFGGNSGSPVFNRRTGKVEGILIQGAQDYVWEEQDDGSYCKRANRVSNTPSDESEKVFRITRIRRKLR